MAHVPVPVPTSRTFCRFVSRACQRLGALGWAVPGCCHLGAQSEACCRYRVSGNDDCESGELPTLPSRMRGFAFLLTLYPLLDSAGRRWSPFAAERRQWLMPETQVQTGVTSPVLRVAGHGIAVICTAVDGPVLENAGRYRICRAGRVAKGRILLVVQVPGLFLRRSSAAMLALAVAPVRHVPPRAGPNNPEATTLLQQSRRRHQLRYPADQAQQPRQPERRPRPLLTCPPGWPPIPWLGLELALATRARLRSAQRAVPGAEESTCLRANVKDGDGEMLEERDARG